MTDSATPACDCHGEPMCWSKNKALRAGGSWTCRVKKREAERRRRLAKGDHVRTLERARYRRIREQRLAYQRGYYARNREAKVAYQRMYYTENRDAVIARQCAYYAANSSWLNLNQSLSGAIRY